MPESIRIVEDEDGAPYPEWVQHFVEWAEGHTETLDFKKAEVPQRLRVLLEHGFFWANNA